MAEATPTVRRSSDNNIYTTLLLIALIALIIGVGYLWYRDSQLSGSINPFNLQSGATVSMVQPAALLS